MSEKEIVLSAYRRDELVKAFEQLDVSLKKVAGSTRTVVSNLERVSAIAKAIKEQMDFCQLELDFSEKN